MKADIKWQAGAAIARSVVRMMFSDSIDNLTGLAM
jgi:hypothetical protein